MAMVFYVYFATIYEDDSAAGQNTSGQNTSLFVFAKPPVKGQELDLESTGKRVVFTDVNHYRMTIDAVPVKSVVSKPHY